MINKYMTGYLYGLLGSLAGTILFVLIHVLISIYRNGLDVYLQFWDYPKYMLFVGVVISIIPSGLSGVVLAHLLWKEFENGKLFYKRALLKGGLIGIVGVLIVFGFVMITPLASIFFRMGSLGLVYLIAAFIIGWSAGRWTGSGLAKSILNNNGITDIHLGNKSL